MKAKYDFSKGKRGAVLPQAGNKIRITIRLDRDIVDWFRSKVEEQGGGITSRCSMTRLENTLNIRTNPLKRFSAELYGRSYAHLADRK